MTTQLTPQHCPVRECGASVLQGQVDGAPMYLNPVWMDIAVPGADGRLTLVRGLQPHAATCVDIAPRSRLAAPLKALVVLAVMGGVLAACSSGPRGDLVHIEDEDFMIGNLSRDKAWSTGIGCALNAHDAQAKARETAEYNLRSVTGASKYRIEFTRGRKVPGEERVCWEVRAQAIPTLTR